MVYNRYLGYKYSIFAGTGGGVSCRDVIRDAIDGIIITPCFQFYDRLHCLLLFYQCDAAHMVLVRYEQPSSVCWLWGLVWWISGLFQHSWASVTPIALQNNVGQ